MRIYMGPAIEGALQALGSIASERQEVIAYIWECGCRSRLKHNSEVAEWAEKAHMDSSEGRDEAKRELQTLLNSGKK